MTNPEAVVARITELPVALPTGIRAGIRSVGGLAIAVVIYFITVLGFWKLLSLAGTPGMVLPTRLGTAMTDANVLGAVRSRVAGAGSSRFTVPMWRNRAGIALLILHEVTLSGIQIPTGTVRLLPAEAC